jgi:hypothetical protein
MSTGSAPTIGLVPVVVTDGAAFAGNMGITRNIDAARTSVRTPRLVRPAWRGLKQSLPFESFIARLP